MDTHETKIYIAILVSAITLAVLIVFFTVTILRHHRRNLALYKEKVAAEITTLEKERTRIASDLHDDLGPVLSAIKFQVAGLDARSEADQKMVKKINGHINEVIEKIRTTSNDLVPLVLVRKGFNTALQQFVSAINETGKLNILLYRNTNTEPATEKALHLFRMIQEMINNTIKHAKANNCTITINKTNNHLVITISDDGIGFDSDKISRLSHGFGLQNILSRADILKARIFIEAKPGKGVTYTIELPNP